MADLTVTIGGRDYEVACRDGEEQYLKSAAKMLDTEATSLGNQVGRLPEARMLLMSGLLLADKMAGLEESLRVAEAQVAEAQARLQSLASAPPPKPERVEIPTIPAPILDTLAELAARAEAVADTLEEKTAG